MVQRHCYAPAGFGEKGRLGKEALPWSKPPRGAGDAGGPYSTWAPSTSPATSSYCCWMGTGTIPAGRAGPSSTVAHSQPRRGPGHRRCCQHTAQPGRMLRQSGASPVPRKTCKCTAERWAPLPWRISPGLHHRGSPWGMEQRRRARPGCPAPLPCLSAAPRLCKLGLSIPKPEGGRGTGGARAVLGICGRGQPDIRPALARLKQTRPRPGDDKGYGKSGFGQPRCRADTGWARPTISRLLGGGTKRAGRHRCR